jgi:hypothetical protein
MYAASDFECGANSARAHTTAIAPTQRPISM